MTFMPHLLLSDINGMCYVVRGVEIALTHANGLKKAPMLQKCNTTSRVAKTKD